jgi:hypothetical protein
MIDDFLTEPEIIKYGSNLIRASDLVEMQDGDWTLLSKK